MTEPITPQEAAGKKRDLLPEFVLEAFNDLIALKWDGRNSSFTQDEVIERIIAKANPADTKRFQEKMFNEGWLDVAGIYQLAGWIVTFDRATYGENYSSFYVFKSSHDV